VPYLDNETAFTAVFISFDNEFSLSRTILKELGSHTPWLSRVQTFDMVC
jgi:hypothetical protein